eukprot:736828-Amphidinium_carterae.1
MVDTGDGVVTCKAGTQFVDGYWKHLKRCIQYLMPASDSTIWSMGTCPWESVGNLLNAGDEYVG